MNEQNNWKMVLFNSRTRRIIKFSGFKWFTECAVVGLMGEGGSMEKQ